MESIATNETIGSLAYNISKIELMAYVSLLSKELSGTGLIVTVISPE